MNTVEAECEERIMDALEKQIKDVMTRVKQQAWDLWDEFSHSMQVTQQDIQATRCYLEATRWDLET
jgi:hypothetical protein